MALWIVRAGDRGQQEDKALNLNLVAMDWKLPDLSQSKDKQGLEFLYRQVYPNAKKRNVSDVVAQLWDFINDIKIGHLVVSCQIGIR
jgi:restriction system protein